MLGGQRSDGQPAAYRAWVGAHDSLDSLQDVGVPDPPTEQRQQPVVRNRGKVGRYIPLERFGSGVSPRLSQACYISQRLPAKVNAGEKRTLEMKLLSEVEPPPPLPPPPVYRREKQPRPRRRLALGGAAVVGGALLAGFGISGLAVSDACIADATPPEVCRQRFGTTSIGAGLLSPNTLAVDVDCATSHCAVIAPGIAIDPRALAGFTGGPDGQRVRRQREAIAESVVCVAVAGLNVGL